MNGCFHPLVRTQWLIEAVQVVIAHVLDQFVCVVRICGVPSPVDLSRERVGIVLELQGAGIPTVAQEKPGMLGDALLEALVFGEIGFDHDVLAFDVFRGSRTNGAQRATPLDAEQVFCLTDRVLSPAGLEDGLRNRDGRRHTGRRHGAPSILADKLDEFLPGHAADTARS